MLKPIPISLLSKFIMDIFRSNSFLTRLEKDLLSEALDFLKNLHSPLIIPLL